MMSLKTPLPALLAAAALAGCAGMNTIESDVSTFSKWPVDRKPSTYTFERLPSQQARAKEQDRLEAVARAAVEASGFQPAADPATADVTVQLGARASRMDRSPYDDPLWWRGGLYYSRYGRYPYAGPYYGPYYGPGLAYRFDTPRYDREVVVLFRDRQSGEPLYEARAENDGNTPGSKDLLAAMFRAAMMDFPSTGVNPRRVTVPLAP